MAKIVLGDGGAYHRLDRQHIFQPGLRAAAHYLKAVEEVNPEVRRGLADQVLAKHRFSRDFPAGQGLYFTPKTIGLKPTPSWMPSRREQFKRARPFLAAYQRWATKYYMWSPFLAEVLFKTLTLWDDLRKDLNECKDTIRAAEEYEETAALTDRDLRFLDRVKVKRQFLEEELKGWGWWVDLLASDLTSSQISSWLRDKNAQRPDHRRVLERLDRLPISLTWEGSDSLPSFRLILDGWHPEEEIWAAAEKRFRDSFEERLREYRRSQEEGVRSGRRDPFLKDSEHVKWGQPQPLRPTPTKYGDHHFRWLALRQVVGLRPQEIANLPDVEAKISAVNSGIQQAAELLELELRPVRSGPPSVLGD